MFLILIFIITYTHGWYSTYLYRKKIDVVNSIGSPQTNYHVQYIVDTTTLVSNGYLQSDCLDMDFTDSNDNKLDFWIEQGCNYLSQTIIWVKMPSLPNGASEIRIYFGSNEIISSTQGLTWENRFGFMKSTSCTAGWSVWSNMAGKFGMGSSFEDTTSDYGSHTHSHNTVGQTLTTGGVVTGGACDGTYTVSLMGGQLAKNSHSHSIYLTKWTTAGSNLPRHMKYDFCYPSATTSGGLDQLIPYDSVVMVEGSVSVTNFGNDDNVNNNEYYVQGNGFGIYTDSHTHDIDFTGASWSGVGTWGCNGYAGSSYYSQEGHIHDPGTLSVYGEYNTPPFRYMTFKKASGNTYFSGEVITFQYCDGAICVDPPLGWARFSGLDNVFPRGTNNGFTSTHYDSHYHSFPTHAVGYSDYLFAYEDSGPYYTCSWVHQHYIDAGDIPSVSSSNAVPKYARIRYIKRKPTTGISFTDNSLEWRCFGILEHDTSNVCGNHGDCLSPDHCDCINNNYYGFDCNVTTCYGIPSNETSSVCYEGNGLCREFDYCDCNANYYGDICNYTTCFDIQNNDTEHVCDVHGECIFYNDCECVANYTGYDCSNYSCYSFHFQNESTCSGHGNCTSHDICECQSDLYSLNNCGEWYCYGTSNQDLENVCNGHGDCIDHDDCVCYDGYIRYDCYDFKCGDYDFSDPLVCSKKGNCSGHNYCTCFPQYYFNSSSFECLHCPNGSRHDTIGGYGINDCEKCPNGTFSTVSTTNGCEKCPKGTYSNDEHTGCLKCPLGTYNDKEGMNGIEDCGPCEPGYYGDEIGLVSKFSCSTCPMGTRNPKFGSVTIDDCLACDDEDECPIGSSAIFPIESQYTINLITYEDVGVTLFSDEVPFEFKISVMLSIIFLCMTLLCFICICTYFCPRLICFCSHVTFRCCDFCYDMNHDFPEGEGPIKKSTNLGGVCSIIAICCALIFLIWSVSDFVYGSKKVSTSADFYQANETNQIEGTFEFVVFFYGDFDENNENCSSSFDIDGFTIPSYRFYCNQKFSQHDSFLGCICHYICIDCVVGKSELFVKIIFPHYGKFVRFIRYELILPSFYDLENYNVTGYFYENNGTIDSASVDISIYPRYYSTQSYWNLLLGILDLEDYGKNSHDGIGAGVLSMERMIVDNLDFENDVGIVPFSFNLKVSNFIQIVEEYFPQTLLNFIAQIFSLIGLSVTIFGVFFGKIECFQDFCCCFCWPFNIIIKKREKKKNKKKKKKKEKKEKKNQNQNQKRRADISYEEWRSMQYEVLKMRSIKERMYERITEKDENESLEDILMDVFLPKEIDLNDDNNNDDFSNIGSETPFEMEMEHDNNNNNESSEEALARYQVVNEEKEFNNNNEELEEITEEDVFINNNNNEESEEESEEKEFDDNDEELEEESDEDDEDSNSSSDSSSNTSGSSEEEFDTIDNTNDIIDKNEIMENDNDNNNNNMGNVDEDSEN